MTRDRSKWPNPRRAGAPPVPLSDVAAGCVVVPVAAIGAAAFTGFLASEFLSASLALGVAASTGVVVVVSTLWSSVRQRRVGWIYGMALWLAVSALLVAGVVLLLL